MAAWCGAAKKDCFAHCPVARGIFLCFGDEIAQVRPSHAIAKELHKRRYAKRRTKRHEPDGDDFFNQLLEVGLKQGGRRNHYRATVPKRGIVELQAIRGQCRAPARIAISNIQDMREDIERACIESEKPFALFNAFPARALVAETNRRLKRLLLAAEMMVKPASCDAALLCKHAHRQVFIAVIKKDFRYLEDEIFVGRHAIFFQ